MAVSGSVSALEGGKVGVVSVNALEKRGKIQSFSPDSEATYL